MIVGVIALAMALAIIVIQLVELQIAHNALVDDMLSLGECHNRLAQLAKEICDALNASGIPAPEVRKHKIEK